MNNYSEFYMASQLTEQLRAKLTRAIGIGHLQLSYTNPGLFKHPAKVTAYITILFSLFMSLTVAWANTHST